MSDQIECIRKVKCAKAEACTDTAFDMTSSASDPVIRAQSLKRNYCGIWECCSASTHSVTVQSTCGMSEHDRNLYHCVDAVVTLSEVTQNILRACFTKSNFKMYLSLLFFF